MSFMRMIKKLGDITNGRPSLRQVTFYAFMDTIIDYRRTVFLHGMKRYMCIHMGLERLKDIHETKRLRMLCCSDMDDSEGNSYGVF